MYSKRYLELSIYRLPNQPPMTIFFLLRGIKIFKGKKINHAMKKYIR